MLNYNILQDKQSNYGDEIDPLFDEAVKLALELNKASSSLLQRRLNLGYARAARLLDQMEQAGVVGVAKGSTPREILIKNANEAWLHKPKPQVDKTEIEPENILLDGYKDALSTYKGVMISKNNPEKDMFKINLLNMLKNDNERKDK